MNLNIKTINSWLSKREKWLEVIMVSLFLITAISFDLINLLIDKIDALDFLFPNFWFLAVIPGICIIAVAIEMFVVYHKEKVSRILLGMLKLIALFFIGYLIIEIVSFNIISDIRCGNLSMCDTTSAIYFVFFYLCPAVVYLAVYSLSLILDRLIRKAKKKWFVKRVVKR